MECFPDYLTLDRRIRKLAIPIDINPSKTAYELSIDSTGYKVTNRRELTGQKVGRRWI